MNIKINSIADRGVPKKERLVMKVLRDTDVGEYAVFRAGTEDGGVTTDVRNVFWFPDKPVSAGDFVVLYTKTGTASEKTSASGTKSHFFYWSLQEPLWLPEEDSAVLLHIDTWISFQTPQE